MARRFRPVPGILLLALLACGTPGRNVAVDLPAAREPSAPASIRADIGRLLSADPTASRAAAMRLRQLDDTGMAVLLSEAKRIPLERDPRWLLVLDENHALPPLPPAEEVEFLLWKIGLQDPYDVMKAQSRLLDIARTKPDVLLTRLGRGGAGTEALAVALSLAGEKRALTPLLARYRRARTTAERRALAEAMVPLVGPGLEPPSEGSAEEIERAAAAIETWMSKADTGGPDGKS